MRQACAQREIGSSDALRKRENGGSDEPGDGHDKKMMAAGILALMDELGIERANIVGHANSAMVAFAFTSQWPERAATVDDRRETLADVFSRR